MRSSTDVYIFGDQSIPVLDGLQELLMVKDDAPLTAFLNNSISAIQQEISALPSTEKEEIPRGDTLALLLNAVRKGTGHTAIESAFLCIYEIGYYIEYVPRQAVDETMIILKQASGYLLNRDDNTLQQTHHFLLAFAPDHLPLQLSAARPTSSTSRDSVSKLL